MEHYAYLATFDEVKENDFNLNIPLYVDTFEDEAPVDLDAVKKDIARIERELTTARAALENALREIS